MHIPNHLFLLQVFENRFKNIPSDDYEAPPSTPSSKPSGSSIPTMASTPSTGGSVPSAKAVNLPPVVPPSQRELRQHPPQMLNVDNTDSDSDTTRDKNDWYQRLLQVCLKKYFVKSTV